MFSVIRAPNLNLDGPRASALSDIEPGGSGDRDRIDRVGNDDVTYAKIVLRYCVGGSVPCVVQGEDPDARVSNRLLDRINSNMDRRGSFREGAGNTRLSYAWKPAEHDQHIQQSVGDSLALLT